METEYPLNECHCWKEQPEQNHEKKEICSQKSQDLIRILRGDLRNRIEVICRDQTPQSSGSQAERFDLCSDIPEYT